MADEISAVQFYSCEVEFPSVHEDTYIGTYRYTTGITMSLKLLQITTILDALRWYETNLCNVELRDPRDFRVRFKCEHFIHHIKLKNKYGKEPKNRKLAIEEIRSGKIQFVEGRYDPQRVSEIPWAVELATRPMCICANWQAAGTGDENYVRNFGTDIAPQWRVLVCKAIGRTRHFSTMFARDIRERDLAVRIWP